MRLPSLTPPDFTLHNSTAPTVVQAGVEPQGCNVFKKIACAGALVACAAVCAGTGGAACPACFAALGMGSCIDCL